MSNQVGLVDTTALKIGFAMRCGRAQSCQGAEGIEEATSFRDNTGQAQDDKGRMNGGLAVLVGVTEGTGF